jgi:hypothetical protein
MYLVTILIVSMIIILIDMKYIGGKDGLGKKPRIIKGRRTRKRP